MSKRKRTVELGAEEKEVITGNDIDEFVKNSSINFFTSEENEPDYERSQYLLRKNYQPGEEDEDEDNGEDTVTHVNITYDDAFSSEKKKVYEELKVPKATPQQSDKFIRELLLADELNAKIDNENMTKRYLKTKANELSNVVELEKPSKQNADGNDIYIFPTDSENYKQHLKKKNIYVDNSRKLPSLKKLDLSQLKRTGSFFERDLPTEPVKLHQLESYLASDIYTRPDTIVESYSSLERRPSYHDITSQSSVTEEELIDSGEEHNLRTILQFASETFKCVLPQIFQCKKKLFVVENTIENVVLILECEFVESDESLSSSLVEMDEDDDIFANQLLVVKRIHWIQ